KRLRFLQTRVFSGVAAGVSPAVEPGILPGGTSSRIPQLKSSGCLRIAEEPGVLSGRQDAALYGSQDGRRYTKHIQGLFHLEKSQRITISVGAKSQILCA